jgi:hypothetical protein
MREITLWLNNYTIWNHLISQKNEFVDEGCIQLSLPHNMFNAHRIYRKFSPQLGATVIQSQFYIYSLALIFKDS